MAVRPGPILAGVDWGLPTLHIEPQLGQTSRCIMSTTKPTIDTINISERKMSVNGDEETVCRQWGGVG